MAEKNNKQSGPEVQTVTAPTAGEMTRAATKGTSKLAGAAATGNVQGAMTSLAGQGNLLQSGGAFALDPALKSQFDNLSSSVYKLTGPWQNKVTQADTALINARADLQRLQEKITAGTATKNERKAFSKAQQSIAQNEAIKADLGPKIEAQNARISTFMAENVAEAPQFTDLLKEKFPELAQQLVESQPFLDQMGKLGPRGEAMMAALQGGFQGSDISWNNAQAVGSSGAQLGASPTAVANQAGYTQGPQAALGQAASVGYIGGPQAASAGMVAGPQAFLGQAAMTNRQDIGADRVSAAQMSGVRDVDASRIRSGALGQSLMNRAIAGVEGGGRLNAEASRDAVQAARQGFAARGMATSGASMAAELLNRDRYSRQRESQDLQFAGQTQAADLARRQANQQAMMDAQRLNQAADITQNQTNAGFVQQANLANQDAGLRAAQLNQAGDQFNAGNQQAMNLANMSSQNQMGLAGYQGAMNQNQFNAANQQAANLAAYQGDINQGQFNAGNLQAMNLANMSSANQMGLAGYQGDINQNQFNTGQANTIGMANLDLAGRYGLQQGQMTQQNNQFNASNQQQNNQFNATGQFNAMGAQADNNRLNFGANINALQGAYGLGQSVLQGGLAAAGIKSGLAGAANPNATMLNMYGSAQPVGSQAMGPATSMANTWATNALGASMFNANANNWASGQQWMMNNMPSMQSGGNWLTGGLAGGLGGAALGFQVGGPTGALVGGVGGFAAGAGASQIR
jgi:hypothetical protein